MSAMPETRIQPVILCGGHGARLWPLSTERRPKPFLPLLSDRSMLAETADRLKGPCAEFAFAPIFAVGSSRHEALLKEALPGAALVLEPAARNSAAAVAAACLAARPGLLLLLPADHHIADIEAFHRAIGAGIAAAQEGNIVTFGIHPDRPATEYGYIETAGAFELYRAARVATFVEKPDLEAAQAYLASGRHLWNAGIFLARCETLIDELAAHAPDILEAVQAASGGPAAGALDGGQVRRLDPAGFARVRPESIDYAVMEKSERVVVVPAEMGWTDIGDHGALYRHKGSQGQRTHEGAVFTQDAEDCFIRSEGPLVAVRGVRNLAIVATTRGVLVTPLADAGSTKPLAEEAAVRGFAGAISDIKTAEIRNWLFDVCLPVWADAAWDNRHGGFVEALGLDGSPLAASPRRGRVAPRQIFAFSKAKMLGWNDPRADRLIADGLDWLDTRGRSQSGAWASLLSPAGEALDPTATLYDHAFIALAGAWAYRACGEVRAREMAEEALTIIESRMADPLNGGYFDSEHRNAPRRSNPHMHLLEAALSLYQATSDSAVLDLALSVVELFESRFFDVRSGALTEFFGSDWSRTEDDAGRLSEPGHCYEWAVLLAFFEEAEGRDLVSWRRRLIQFADCTGRGPAGFAYDAVTTDKRVLKSTRRLWPQLEMFRARLFHPETAAPGEAERLLTCIQASYLSDGPQGGWMDAYDENGRPCAPHVPASMLYHIVTAFSPLCWRV